MKKVYFILSAIVFFACTEAETSNAKKGGKGYVVTANIMNAENGQVILDKIVGQNTIPVDTAEIKGGEFTFEGEVPEADFYRIRLPKNNQFVFVLDNAKIKIEGDANDIMNTAKFEGSDDSNLFFEINKTSQAMQQKSQELSGQYQQAQINGDTETMKSIEAQFNEVQAKSGETINNIIKNNPNSIVSAFYTLSFVNPEANYEFFAEITEKFEETLPDHKFTKELVAKAQKFKSVAVGQMAPEIDLPSPDGTNLKLSSLRGKYVLIDFWASWCKPCRMENPNVVKMYAEYKDKNFEIFGVSFDKSKDKWVAAIEKDGITWQQVSDLAGWSSVAGKAYQVTSIPSTYLIDPEGKIIAKNLRGKALEDKLAEILK